MRPTKQEFNAARTLCRLVETRMELVEDLLNGEIWMLSHRDPRRPDLEALAAVGLATRDGTRYMAGPGLKRDPIAGSIKITCRTGDKTVMISVGPADADAWRG